MVVVELNVKCLGNDSLKGLQHLAQGIALGYSWRMCYTPCKGKSPNILNFIRPFENLLIWLLPLRVFPSSYKTQGAALGYELIGPTGRSKSTCESI